MRHTLSLVLSAVLVPVAALAQTPAAAPPATATQVLSTNPLGLTIEWVNIEFERKTASELTLGASASHLAGRSGFGDSGQSNAAILLRWYPPQSALEGFYFGARAGAYRFDTFAYDYGPTMRPGPPVRRASRTAGFSPGESRHRVLKYAAWVVVIVTGSDRSRAARIGRALAGALRWPTVDTDDPHALHALVATVLGRREHLVAVAAPLSTRDHPTVRGDLHNVRFVDVTEPAQPPDDVVGWIRREFGV